MTASELTQIKSRIESTLLKRSGNNAVDMYTGGEYAVPDTGGVMSADVGRNTVDLLLNITGNSPDRDIFPELGTGSDSGGVIPSAFNIDDINRICDELDSDFNAPGRGSFEGYDYRGRYINVSGGTGDRQDDGVRTESNHCNGSCAGMCSGSCIGMCNGCSNSCSGCMHSCTGSAGATGTQSLSGTSSSGVHVFV